MLKLERLIEKETNSTGDEMKNIFKEIYMTEVRYLRELGYSDDLLRKKDLGKIVEIRMEQMDLFHRLKEKENLLDE